MASRNRSGVDGYVSVAVKPRPQSNEDGALTLDQRIRIRRGSPPGTTTRRSRGMGCHRSTVAELARNRRPNDVGLGQPASWLLGVEGQERADSQRQQ